MAVQQLARANDMEVLDWLSVRTGVRAGLLRRRADTGERWVVVAHGFATNHPQYSTRYLLRLGETADTFGAFATQKSLVAVIEKLVLPELRSEFTAPDPGSTNGFRAMTTRVTSAPFRADSSTPPSSSERGGTSFSTKRRTTNSPKRSRARYSVVRIWKSSRFFPKNSSASNGAFALRTSSRCTPTRTLPSSPRRKRNPCRNLPS